MSIMWSTKPFATSEFSAGCLSAYLSRAVQGLVEWRVELR